MLPERWVGGANRRTPLLGVSVVDQQPDRLDLTHEPGDGSPVALSMVRMPTRPLSRWNEEQRASFESQHRQSGSTACR